MDSSKTQRSFIYAVRVGLIAMLAQMAASPLPFSRQSVISGIIFGIVAILNFTSAEK